MSLLEFGLGPAEMSMRALDQREALAELGALRQQISDLQARVRVAEARSRMLEESRKALLKVAWR